MLTRPALALLCALAPLACNYSFGADLDGLVNRLSQPAGWRALGNVAPGVTDGVNHDLYANSAVIAAVLKSQGIDVPFVKLTDDPAMAGQALSDYLQRLQSKPEVTDETCGVAVSHVYGLTLSQLLVSKGPQWVTPGISDADAQSSAQRAAVGFRDMHNLAIEMCDSRTYRRLNQAFDALLARVSGEMPYLLNTALPQGQGLEEQQHAQQAAATATVAAADQSRQLGRDMLTALQGVSPSSPRIRSTGAWPSTPRAATT